MTTFTPQHLIQNWIESDPGTIEPGGFVRYDPDTGTLLEVGTMAASFIEEHIGQGRPYAHAPSVPFESQLDFLASNYVDLATKQVMAKAEFTGVLNGTVVTGLPMPCSILIRTLFQTGRDAWWAPQSFEWSDPDVDLAFGIPDTYLVTVESVTQKTGRFRIEHDA